MGDMSKFFGWIKRIRNRSHQSETTTNCSLKDDSVYYGHSRSLAARGSGTICLCLKKHGAFNFDLIANNAFLRLSVNEKSITLSCIYQGQSILLKADYSYKSGLDINPTCLYWISFNAKSRTISFGKHRPVFANINFLYTLPTSNKSSEQYWMNNIAHYRISTPAQIYLSQNIVKKYTTFSPRINLLSGRS